MKKFASINKRSSQLFLAKRAQTFLKLASIYDEFGDFDMAEYVQSEAIKYSKFIRIAEDLTEEEDDYLNQEADVREDAENLPIENAKQYFQNIAHPEFNDPITNWVQEEFKIGDDHFYINPNLFGLPGRKSTYMENDVRIPELVKVIIKYLSPGGRNIYNSLKSLSDFIVNYSSSETLVNLENTILSNDLLFNKVLGIAFATYYNCPSFLFSNYSTMVRNLKYGQVDAGSVSIIKHILDEYKKDIDTSLSIREQIVNKIPEMPNDPELAKKMVAYFFRKYNLKESIMDEIPNYDFKKLSLAIIHGFDNFNTIDSKYYALTNLPEELVMPIIDKPLHEWNVSGDSNTEITERLTGFSFNMNSYHPLYKIFLNYLAKNPQVGKQFRFTYPYSLPFNQMLYYINLLPPDQIDSYLSYNQNQRTKEKFSSLGLYLSDTGILPDYNNVCQDIKDNTEIDPFRNVNYYLLYKADREKALKVISLYNNASHRLDDINFTIIDPNKFMDYALANPNIINYNFTPEELCLAFNDLGDDLFRFPPAILESMCTSLSKSYSYNDSKKYDLYRKIMEVNPNLNLLSQNEQSEALSFYRLSDTYAGIPYDKVINFTKFSGIIDRTTAANHLLLFGEYSPEWVDNTPRNIGSNSDVETIRRLGESLKNDGFVLAPIDNILSVYNQHLSNSEHKDRPFNEIALISSYNFVASDINQKFITIDEVKKSIANSALKSSAYAEIQPGSRDYYYMIHYLSNDYSLRGRNPKLFFLLRDLTLKTKIYNMTGLDSKEELNKVAFTLIKNLNLEPNTTNFQKLKKQLYKIKRAGSRKPYSYNDILFIATVLFKNNNNDIEIELDNDQIKEIFDNIYDNRTLQVEPMSLIDDMEIKISNTDMTKYDNSLGVGGSLSDDNTKVTKAISIFGNLLPQSLDQFARVLCKSLYNLKVTDVHSLSNEQLEQVIRRFTQNLPTKNQNYIGYAQYFQNKFSNINDLGVLRRIGDNWNAEVKLFDQQNKLVGIDNLKNIARNYSMPDLNRIIKITTASEILEDFENCDRTFLRAFADYDSCFGDDVTELNSYTVKAHYPEREKVYLDGLNVPLPSWANYRNSIQKPGTNEKITLRFLPRDDPRGMYLGVIAGCCQHPDGEAGTCAVDGHVNPKAAFMVIEQNKELIAEAYTWEDNTGNICFDSLETIGEKAFHSERTKEAIKQLLIDFGKAQEDCLVTVGNNKLEFERSSVTLANPTNYYQGYKESLGYEDFYRSDHEVQHIVADTRNYDYDQRTYNIDNPPQYSGDKCPLCLDMSLVDGECRSCDFKEDDYYTCPACNERTFDDEGVCQSRECEFRYSECPICEENKFDEDANRCTECRYNREYSEECPRCGEDSVIDGDCLINGCNYSSDDYEECPNCNQNTYDEDSNECFKCGYQKEDDDEEEEEIVLLDEED